MSESSGEIIIRGGSAQIQFDPTLFAKDESDPPIFKQKDKDLKITQVIIENGDQHTTAEFTRNGFKGTIRVKFKYLK